MSSLETNGQFQRDPSYSISTTSLQSHARSLTYNQQYSLPSTTAPLAPFTNNSTVGSVHVHGSYSQVYPGPVSHQSAAEPFHPQQQSQLHVPFPPSFTSGNMAATASFQPHARRLDTYNQEYGLPGTTAPLAPFTNNSTLESVHVHGSRSQGYHDPVSHQSAAEPFHPRQPSQLHVPFPPSFTPGNMEAPTTHANGAAGTSMYGPPVSNPNPVYALQTHTALALVSAPTNSFFTSITTTPSSTVPFSVGALIPASGDGGGPPLKERETDEDPPLPPPAADCSPLQKLLERLREQGGDEAAIARVPVVFKNGVSKNALKLRRRKTGSGRSINFDQGYMNFVGRRQVKKENETGKYFEDEWWCRLCPREDRKLYFAFKNLQPHLCSKHFGLPGRGKTSGVSPSNKHNRCQTLTVFRIQNV